MNVWKHIAASVVGTSHSSTETDCQDSSACRVLKSSDGSDVLVAVAADGAGSAKRADAGSALACSLFLQEMDALFAEGTIAAITEKFVKEWLTSFQQEVRMRAEHEDLTPRDFASTFLAAVIGNDSAVFAQIGDGAIVLPSPEEPDEYCYVFWPQKGEYANETYFITDKEAPARIQYALVTRRVEEVALFTDGIQSLALQYQPQQAHNPFFRPIFAWLRPAPEDNQHKFNLSLETYLGSEKVNQATDDDKTLILATRRTTSIEPESSPDEANAPAVLQQ